MNESYIKYQLAPEQIKYLQRKGPGYCKCCLTETLDVWYTFCSIECSTIWYNFYEGISLTKEYNMAGVYEIDKELYKKWLEGKTPTIEGMATKEAVEERVAEIIKIQFFAKEELRLLAQQYDKVAGRKGIPPWLKAERDKLITDPDAKVNWDGEPRPRKKSTPKSKAEKDAFLKEATGFDLSELTSDIKARMAEKKAGSTSQAPKPKAMSMADAIDLLVQDSPAKPEEPKVSGEVIESKANSLREKLRLAKEAREKGNS